MQFESRITWEKLSLELELLSSEEPKSLIPLIVAINSVLCPTEDPEWISRHINFMGYELCAKTKDFSESERFEVLNDFFFQQKKFQIILSKEDANSENDYLMKSVLANKSGATLPIALLYMYLADKLDLPVDLVNLPKLCVLKWVRSGKSSFINISDHGRLLCEEELLELVHHSLDKANDNDMAHLDILPQKKVFICYLRSLAAIYLQSELYELLHMVYNMILKVEPTSVCFLAKRALLRKDLGLPKEAMSDLKRYFSFTDRAQAPAEIKMAYYELQALNSAIQSTPPNPNLLH